MSPLYESLCSSCGYRVHEFRSVKELGKGFWCPDCNRDMDIVIQAPLVVKAAPDVCYDSPVTGAPITSWQARQEDLKRHGCRPYDPEQKKDVARQQRESEAQLDKSVDETVERAFAKMDTRTRGKLASELLDQGTTAEVIRTTPT